MGQPQRLVLWLRKKHKRLTWQQVRRRYWKREDWVSPEGRRLYWPGEVAVTRYRYRGRRIASPWAPTGQAGSTCRPGTAAA
jgi:RNA-directed DNA polymerase